MNLLTTRVFFLKILIPVLLLIFVGLFFSYKILDVPTGLTSDESAFGYNAVLLSRTLHDQNGRFLPVFILTLDGSDWKQPITEYYIAILFKIFGASVFLLRFSSVLITLFSTILLYFLTKKIFNNLLPVYLSLIIFLTTPIIMLQSHLGLDNIMPIPFTIIWLFTLYQYIKTKNKKYMILSAISLGVNFYSYKGMRGIVPSWCITTTIYIWVINYHKYKKLSFNLFKEALPFILGVAPFFLIIPFLESKYPGAVFDKQGAAFSDIYNFLYPYFSNFDISFLYITGDALLFHSTGKHGMMLLATMPIFIYGSYLAVKKGSFWVFLLITFFTAPEFYGFVDSVHRASRIMAIIPIYTLLATLGAVELYYYLSKKSITKIIIFIFIFAFIFNYYDFINYYWYTYPKFTENIFGNLNSYKAFAIFYKESTQRNLTPYIDSDTISDNSEHEFYELIYFTKQTPLVLFPNSYIPANSILLTSRDQYPTMQKLNYSEQDMGSDLKLQIK